jgi:hypothetical protein
VVNARQYQPERYSSTDTCELIRELERLLEAPIPCIPTANRSLEISFWFPGEADTAYLKRALRLIATAARNASKSL